MLATVGMVDHPVMAAMVVQQGSPEIWYLPWTMSKARFMAATVAPAGTALLTSARTSSMAGTAETAGRR